MMFRYKKDLFEYRALEYHKSMWDCTIMSIAGLFQARFQKSLVNAVKVVFFGIAYANVKYYAAICQDDAETEEYKHQKDEGRVVDIMLTVDEDGNVVKAKDGPQA